MYIIQAVNKLFCQNEILFQTQVYKGVNCESLNGGLIEMTSTIILN